MYVSICGSRNDILIMQFFLVVDLLQVPRTNLLSGGTTFSAPQQNITEDQPAGPSIALPPSLFMNLTTRDVGVFFTHYATPVFFSFGRRYSARHCNWHLCHWSKCSKRHSEKPGEQYNCSVPTTNYCEYFSTYVYCNLLKNKPPSFLG